MGLWSQMDRSEIKFRAPKATDLNFIQSTFLKSMKKESSLGRSCTTRVFFCEFPKVIDHVLSISKVLIAHFDSEPDLILGYLIYEPECVHYLYTKASFRNFNVARELINEAFPEAKSLSFSLNTNASKRICEKFPELIHNPFLLYQKEVHE